MEPVKRIVVRRIKRDRGKSLLLSVTVLVLMLMISFFVLFSYSVSSSRTVYGDLPIEGFIGELNGLIFISAASVLVIAIVTLRSYIGIRKEDNRPIIGCLISVGASKKQAYSVIRYEFLYLFFMPILTGTLIGAAFAALISREYMGVFSDKEIGTDGLYYLIMLSVLAFGILIFITCYLLPQGKRSVIDSVRKQNRSASVTAHGYRNSEAFKKMNILKRLAKRGCDYYRSVCVKIAISVASAVLYPIIGAALFVGVAGIELTLDANPYDDINTVFAVREVAEKIVVFFVICFLVLAVIGAFQAVAVIRTQMLRLKDTEGIYHRIGMTAKEIKAMRRYWHLSVLLQIFVILMFAMAVLNMMFFAF